ncbi:MAG TPA: DEAD/DEAH box helicase family protein [Brevefilum sp.]|nr:DEAD/DEAH box helicase family protein [Brevefilum sp.]
MTEQTINIAALEPLYSPWEEPNQHRLKAEIPNGPALVARGRRPSGINIANNLRYALNDWRSNDYVGASSTSRELLIYWFERDHRRPDHSGEQREFRYWFCQREAIESLIFLMEVRGIRTLSEVTAEFGGENAEHAAIGITPEEDQWPRFAFRVATGAGKTKIMSLAITWSYFHTLRESESPMARNFLVVAPNLTVFERLKEDFGDGRIFDTDPLIPPAWRGDWNLSVVLQDEASGAATSGTLYLTNIHRLHPARSRARKEAETYDWMGPAVSKASALDTSEALRKRVSAHDRLMVLNDEAHHLWDPDSAAMEVMGFLDNAYKNRNGFGISAQLDFTATPKDQDGNLFKQIICDYPLSEAVDSGIVKVPIIGHVGQLQERADENAAYRYEEHLRLGYARWEKSYQEWNPSGFKPILFVMCEDTKAADQITRRLDSDPSFEMLNGKTINLHTNLKGKLKKVKRGKATDYEFVEDEKSISDEDLRQLRKLSRELDANTSPYRCIVSVLMLREGWDVRNVTTIVPLRPYSAKANILPEQTLGRGLRRMTPAGQALEMVTVVEHNAFVRLYRDEFQQQGVNIIDTGVENIPRTTVSIYPDPKKDWAKLDICLPRLSPAHRVVPLTADISYEEVLQSASGLPRLKLGTPRKVELDFEGRSLITNEVVERMKISLPLLQTGIGAISFFREELEKACGVRGLHPKIAPLIERYLEEDLFEEKVSLFDERLVARMPDPDVREYVRAVFIPLIRQKTTRTEERTLTKALTPLSTWKAYQVTHSENRPTVAAESTLFNLVPCDRQLEVAFTTFLNRAEDVLTFSKNAGPQALRIDYLTSKNRLAFYTPDFFVKAKDGTHYLVETKGQVDQEVPNKAQAASAWCQSASDSGTAWEYLYVLEGKFSGFTGSTLGMLKSTCAPDLQDLLKAAVTQQPALPFYQISTAQKESLRDQFIKSENYARLPESYREMIDESVSLFNFLKNKGGSFSPCFTPLLKSIDAAAKAMVLTYLRDSVPTQKAHRDAYFMPDYFFISERDQNNLRKNAAGLKKALVYNSFIMPIGMLGFCLEYAKMDPPFNVGGIFETIREQFGKFNRSQLCERVDHIRAFRNKYIAHQEEGVELTDVEFARVELKNWITGLSAIHKSTVES